MRSKRGPYARFNFRILVDASVLNGVWRLCSLIDLCGEYPVRGKLSGETLPVPQQMVPTHMCDTEDVH